MLVWILAALCLVLAATTILLMVRARPPSPAVVEPAPVRPMERDPSAALEQMELGVVVLSSSLGPVFANAAARRLLRLPADSLPVRLQSDEVLSIARRALNSGKPAETELSLWPDRKRVNARAVSDGEDIFVFLDDVTDEVLAHQIRRQFVLNASHELKTPVASIQALAETVNQAIEDDAENARRFARKLLIESERLSRLIQDLLDLSRLEDPAHFSDASVDLGAVSERESEGLRRLAEERGIKLVVDVTPGTMVRGDEQQLGLLVRNLVDNAIRYTPGDGHVQVRVLQSNGHVVLEVEDTGAGIPLNAQSRVFERFFRVDQDRSRASGGTGLGLSIVKHVAELHGGHVSLRSELGEGSTFTVQIPHAETQ